MKYPEHPQAVTSQYGNGKEYVWKPHPLGAKPRDVIEMPTLCNTTKEKTLHLTQKPEELIRKFILASSNERDLVIDPFGGSGTTYIVCERYNRRWLGCEISEEHCQIIKERLENPDEFSSERICGSERKIIKRREKLRFGQDADKDATQMELFSESN